MSKIVFFCIPAFGHTNPTVEVVKELVNRGNEVLYYSFEPFKEKLEEAGAKVVLCEKFLPPEPKNLDKKVGKDFSTLIEMVVDTTMNMEESVCNDLGKFKPDVIVSDSVCFWGKLFAFKLNIPYICSTTTFAFNRYTAKLMKPKLSEIITSIKGMPKINAKMELLRKNGYPIKDFISIIQNDNNTNTIVYTSKEFQPMPETFSEEYYNFVGPSINTQEVEKLKNRKKAIYISLGTVMYGNKKFFKNCIKALENKEIDVIMSVGEKTDINDLGKIPSNFIVKNKVEQVKVLQNVDAFITHCGMNSANEAMYFEVPCILVPQQSEEYAVANRISQLGAGIMLKRDNPKNIEKEVKEILNNNEYKEKAKKISETFKKSGGAPKAADAILKICNNK